MFSTWVSKLGFRYVICIAVIVGFIVGVSFYAVLFGTYSRDEPGQVISASMEAIDAEERPESCEVVAYLTGSVNQPGIFCLDGNAIYDDLVGLAGGFSDSVCQKWLDREFNMAGRVEPNSKLYVPGSTDPECTMGVDEGNVEIPIVSMGMCDGGAININTASIDQLDSLPGIGPSTAQKIIDARPYTSTDALLDVKGIGDSTYEEIAGLVCI